MTNNLGMVGPKLVKNCIGLLGASLPYAKPSALYKFNGQFSLLSIMSAILSYHRPIQGSGLGTSNYMVAISGLKLVHRSKGANTLMIATFSFQHPL